VEKCKHVNSFDKERRESTGRDRKDPLSDSSPQETISEATAEMKRAETQIGNGDGSETAKSRGSHRAIDEEMQNRIENERHTSTEKEEKDKEKEKEKEQETGMDKEKEQETETKTENGIGNLKLSTSTLEGRGWMTVPANQKMTFRELCHGGVIARAENDRPLEAEEIYFLGIIDILTVYNFKKKSEHTIKSLLYDSNAISAIPPGPYRQRFVSFMDSITL